MEKLVEVLSSKTFIIASLIVNIILLILVIIFIILTIKNNKKYISFMNKLGNGNNLDEMLKKYLEDVKNIKNDNSQIKSYCTKLDKDISMCIQKVGILRYNAFNDVGGDLSFALALLDKENNGIVLNGIYGSQTSNIYSKPIKNGNSKYQLSDEEKYAIELAEKIDNVRKKGKE